MLGRLRELGLGLPQDIPTALRLYRSAIARAPQEADAMAPFLALHWLRLRLLLRPLLRPLLRLLGPAGRVLAAGIKLSLAEQPAAAAAAAAVAAGGAAQQPGHRSPALPAQWDTLLILALVGVLTWVLWRKRQLGQQPAADGAVLVPPPAAAGAQLSADASPAATTPGLPAARHAAETPATPPQEMPERPTRSAAAAAAAAAEQRYASATCSDAVVTAGLRLRAAAAAKAAQQGEEPGNEDQPGGSRF